MRSPDSTDMGSWFAQTSTVRTHLIFRAFHEFEISRSVVEFVPIAVIAIESYRRLPTAGKRYNAMHHHLFAATSVAWHKRASQVRLLRVSFTARDNAGAHCVKNLAGRHRAIASTREASEDEGIELSDDA